MDHSAGHFPCAGSTACNQGLSVIAPLPTARQIIRHTQGHEDALPGPQFRYVISVLCARRILRSRQSYSPKTNNARQPPPSPPPIGRRI